MNDLFEKPLQERVEDFARNWKNENKSDRERPLYQVLWIDLADLFTGNHQKLEFEKETAKGGFADVYSQKYSFIVEQKKPGTNLDKPEKRRDIWVTPFEQAKGYDDDLPKGEKVSTIVISNFDTFRFYDMTIPEGLRGEAYAECTWGEIPQKLELFEKLFKQGEKPGEEWSILDVEHTEEAADGISDLYQSLLEGIEEDKDLGEEEKKKYEDEIPLIIMRIVFLLFANSTSDKLGAIFKNHEFASFLSDTDEVHLSADLITLFKCLNIDGSSARAKAHIPPYMRNFPYVDGELFSFKDLNGEEIDWFPVFPASVYKSLNNLISNFKDWDRIDISVFGTIMDQAFKGEYRHEHGIYNTSKANIQKVIEPLFMGRLRAELRKIEEIENYEEKQGKLRSFHEKLGQLQFLDPACGSGAFLIESFLELRDLEDKVIRLENANYNLDIDVKVSLSQFHGIELDEYAAMIARTSLYVAREQALKRSYSRFRDSAAPHFLPLKDEVKGIVRANALEKDWGEVVTLSPDLYVFGNPPYLGYDDQTSSQVGDLKSVFGKNYYGEFDYCAAWTFKAAKSLNGSGAHFAFVTTSSIVQGTQVTPLFEPIFNMGWRISFAYTPFMWDRSDAAVAVVIIGMTQKMGSMPLLYKEASKELEPVENISQYLTDLPTVFIKKDKNPNMPKIFTGSIAATGRGEGFALKDLAAKEEAESDPWIAKYVRPLMGGHDLIHGTQHWCLWLVGSTPRERKNSKFWQKRALIIEEARKGKKYEGKPIWEFGEDRQPSVDYLAIPRTFTEKMLYFPAGFLKAEVIADSGLCTCTDTPEFAFGIVESLIFMAWQDLIGGRLKKDKRAGADTTWYTFPLPKLEEDQKDRIIERGREILDARALYSDSDLSDLYSPQNMPADLKKAHKKLDREMDSVFSAKPLKTEEERQRALLETYKKMMGEKG